MMMLQKNGSYQLKSQSYKLLQKNAEKMLKAQPHYGSKLTGKVMSLPTEKTETVTQLLTRLSAGGFHMDLAFIVLSMQIKEVDREIATQIKGIEQVGKLRQAISEQIKRLREAKTMLQGWKENKEGRPKSAGKSGAYWTAFPSDLHKELRRKDFTLNTKTGAVDVKVGKPLSNSADLYTVHTIDLEIKRLSNDLTELTSNKDISMVQLNALLNTKNQRTQLLSNILKKSDQSKSSVINNIR